MAGGPPPPSSEGGRRPRRRRRQRTTTSSSIVSPAATAAAAALGLMLCCSTSPAAGVTAASVSRTHAGRRQCQPAFLFGPSSQQPERQRRRQPVPSSSLAGAGRAVAPSLPGRGRALAAGFWRFDKAVGDDPSGGGSPSQDEPPTNGFISLLRILWALARQRVVQGAALFALVVSALGKGKDQGGQQKAGLLNGKGAASPPERYVRPKARGKEQAQAPAAGKGQGDKASSGGSSKKGAPVPLPDAESPVLPPEGTPPAPQTAPQRQLEEEQQEQEQAQAEEGGAEVAEKATASVAKPPTTKQPPKKEGKEEERPKWAPFAGLRKRLAEGGEAASGKRQAKQAEAPLLQRPEGQGQQGQEQVEEDEQADSEEGVETEEEGAVEGSGEEGSSGSTPGESLLDRRGSVLLGHPAAGSGSGSSDAAPAGKEQAPLVQIPGRGQTPTHPRHGSSFVSSVFRAVGPAVPRVDCVKVYRGEIKFASGSGVIFTPEGHLITNSLLVRNALDLKVTLADGREFPAEVKGMDEVLDVAVLKINAPAAPAAPAGGTKAASSRAAGGGMEQQQRGEQQQQQRRRGWGHPWQQRGEQQQQQRDAEAEIVEKKDEAAVAAADAAGGAVGAGGFAYAPIGDSDALQVGDWVMSIGSPKSPGPSVILGIVSGLTKTAAEVGRPETQISFIQTDASFDSGVVGGPLVNEYGEVVGINSIGMTTSSTVQFSVPINQVKDAITALANGKEVRHPSIGVEMMPVTPTLAAQLNQQAARGRHLQQQQKQQQGQQDQANSNNGGKKGKQQDAPPVESEREQAAAVAGAGQIHYIPEGGAVVVVAVLPGSPAQKAGLQNLDILLEIDRRPIYRVEDAQQMIQAAGVGRDLEVKVLRQRQEVTLRVRTTDFLQLFRRQQASRRYPELKRNGGGEEGDVEEEDVMGLRGHQRATNSEEAEASGVDAAEEEDKGEGTGEDRACSRADGLRGHLFA